jgi:hypothetical protein
MGFLQRKYRTILSMAFVLLLTVPCSLKAEFKQFLDIDFTQKSKTTADKPACISYTETQQRESRKFKAGLQPYLATKTPLHKSENHQGLQAEFFSAQKEKIPTYLLYCKFLI